jgi:two-component system chemotaxis response regulator CheY
MPHKHAHAANRAPHGAAGIDDVLPVDAPDDVQDIVDPRTGLPVSDSAAPDADGSDVDAIVRAAKAMRDGPRHVVEAAARTCLIVDDSRVIRKVSTKIARSLGYTAIEAQDGIEALARCKQAMPELILTDWNMPEMDGLDFVKALRAIPTTKAPIVVFCTSKGEVEDIHEGIAAGADDYIVKPFDEAALKAKLERLGRG